MVVYDSKEWWKALVHFHRSYVLRLLMWRLVAVAAVGTLVVGVHRNLLPINLEIDPMLFTIMGIILSLLLVFRTNTAYDRYWEGRQQWGLLVNHCRNLAALLAGLLDPADTARRTAYARRIANFPHALKHHLRRQELRDLDPVESTTDAQLHQAQHKPGLLAAQLWGQLQADYRLKLYTDSDILNLRTHHLALLDIAGACERIRNTPIPFSFAFLIKLFITLYLLLIPPVLVGHLGYALVPALVFAAYALMGIEMLADEIEEPFGMDCNDLPLNQLSETIRQNVHELLQVPLARPVDAPRDRNYPKFH